MYEPGCCNGPQTPTRPHVVAQILGLQASVVTWATDFNTDPGCDRTTDPDTVFSSSLGLNVIMALGADEVNPDGMALVTVRPSDTSMTPDGSPNPRNQPKEF